MFMSLRHGSVHNHHKILLIVSIRLLFILFKFNAYCLLNWSPFRLFAEKCYACKKPIVPKDGSNIAPKLKALDQNYHPECFKCQVSFNVNSIKKLVSYFLFILLFLQSCGLILEDGCYPHKKKAYCFDCYETIRSKN